MDRWGFRSDRPSRRRSSTDDWQRRPAHRAERLAANIGRHIDRTSSRRHRELREPQPECTGLARLDPRKTWVSRNTASGRLTEWIEATEPDEWGTVFLTAHNIWDESSEDTMVTQPLTFRSVDQLRSDLAAAGLSIVTIMGGWQDEPFTNASEMILVGATHD